jgi:hypothetical protein
VRRKNKLISFQHPGTGETRYVQVVTAVVVPPESTEVNPKPTEPKVLRRGFEIAPPLSGNDTDPVDALEKSITEILPPIDQSQAGNTTTELQTLARIRKSGTELYRRALLYRDADGAVIVVLHHATDALLP